LKILKIWFNNEAEMNLNETSNEILIRHVPVKEWIIGGILIFFTFVVCLLLFHAFFAAPSGYYESLIGDWTGIMSVLLPLIAVITAIIGFSAIRAPLTTIRINSNTSSIDITHQRIYGTKTERFYFYQILKFKSYKTKMKTSQQYFPALVLANKRTIKLKIPIGSDQQNTVKFIKKINKFIKPKSLSSQTVAE
jgi:hypothetical protein